MGGGGGGGGGNCLIVAPANDRGYETCDKSKALFDPGYFGRA